MNKADQAMKLFNEAKAEGIIWAITSPKVTMQYLINLSITELKHVTITGDMPMIQFDDESLIVFKGGSWVDHGYYAQTQERLA